VSNIQDWLNDRIILKVYGGSHSYGTNTPNSDIDIRGVCIPPKNYIIGIDNFEQHESKTYIDYAGYNKKKEPADTVIYGLHKFIRLAMNCNPNIIENLFVDRTHIMSKNELGQMLIDNRLIFLTKKARHTFGGYAFSQLHRLTNKLPMEEAKEKLENNNKKIEEYEVHLTKLNHQEKQFYNKLELTGEEVLVLKGLETEIKKYKQLIGTIKENTKEIKNRMGYGNHNHRGSHKDLIDAYGYDTKHAMHLIRLLRAGLEILTEGNCYTLRPDYNYLLAIRNGEYTLEYIKAEADRMFKLLDDAYINSKLPHSPDVNKINNLLCDMTLLSFEKWG